MPLAIDVLIQESVNPTDGEISNMFQTFSKLATMQHRQTGVDGQNWQNECQWNCNMGNWPIQVRSMWQILVEAC
jgi:hypothetical protein